MQSNLQIAYYNESVVVPITHEVSLKHRRSLGFLGIAVGRFVSKEGKENVVTDLDGVDVQQSLGRRDECEVLKEKKGETL